MCFQLNLISAFQEQRKARGGGVQPLVTSTPRISSQTP